MEASYLDVERGFEAVFKKMVTDMTLNIRTAPRLSPNTAVATITQYLIPHRHADKPNTPEMVKNTAKVLAMFFHESAENAINLCSAEYKDLQVPGGFTDTLIEQGVAIAAEASEGKGIYAAFPQATADIINADTDREAVLLAVRFSVLEVGGKHYLYWLLSTVWYTVKGKTAQTAKACLKKIGSNMFLDYDIPL